MSIKFGKVSINPEALEGFTEKKFIETFKGHNFYPYDIKEVWKQVKGKIPKIRKK